MYQISLYLFFVLIMNLLLASCSSSVRFTSVKKNVLSSSSHSVCNRIDKTNSDDFGKQTGFASYYADKFEGRATASGEIYKNENFTAAHRELPFGTKVSVINLQNKRQVIVTINDRGPFIDGRIIDLSRAAAERLDMIVSGLALVEISIIK